MNPTKLKVFETATRCQEWLAQNEGKIDIKDVKVALSGEGICYKGIIAVLYKEQ